MRDITDRVAVVTGASSGIGRATALALARAGAHLVLAARREDALQRLANEVRSLGREALVVPTDVTSLQGVQHLVAQTLEQWQRLEILVTCAGIYYRSPVADISPILLQQSLAVNFYGSVYPVLEALPHMLARGEGHIVMVVSMDGKKGLPPDGPYVAAKFALAGFGEVLRQELHATGVGVTLVFPGRVDTPMIADLEVPWISAKVQPEIVARAILRAIRRRQAEVIVPFQARLLLLVNFLSPRLGDWAVRAFRLEGRQVQR